jgi:4-amino-4-deoxy-L-arabinose transferase-like glycosyltransferase
MANFVQSRWLPLLFILFFWAVSVRNLDRFPTIHNDETAVFAAGYNLFHEGVYGLDMYSGLDQREQIYLEVMPLMPWLQGASSRLLGVGVWQMRLIPVIAGILTLALVYLVAGAIGKRQVGVIAMLLLLFWRWAPGGAMFFGSGVALVDLVRIGRYDILAAPCSLASLWFWLQAVRTGQTRFYVGSGLAVGLASLAQIYGVFWLMALLIYGWYGQRWRGLGRILLGFTAVISIWLLMIATHWQAFLGQFGLHQTRFQLFSLHFYLDNLRWESGRYFLGFGEPGTVTRLGFWMVVILLPVSLIWLISRFMQYRDKTAVWLLIPAFLFPLLLALFIQKKQFAYLQVVMPVFVLATALLMHRWLYLKSPVWRALAYLLLLGMIWEGGQGIYQMQQMADKAQPPSAFFAELRQVLPENGRVIGPQTYWPGLFDTDYRSFVLALLLSDADRPENLSLLMALNRIEADYVIVNPTIQEWTASSAVQFQTYLEQHEGQIVAELIDYEGEFVQVWQLNKP